MVYRLRAVLAVSGCSSKSNSELPEISSQNWFSRFCKKVTKADYAVKRQNLETLNLYFDLGCGETWWRRKLTFPSLVFQWRDREYYKHRISNAGLDREYLIEYCICLLIRNLQIWQKLKSWKKDNARKRLFGNIHWCLLSITYSVSFGLMVSLNSDQWL